jgi:DNA-binding FrmR family transcriptional regulator
MINSIKIRLVHRTKILEGSVRAIGKMIDDEKYCLDIINQSNAIQKSLSSLNKLLLENHIRTHLKHQLASRDKREIEKAVEEMVKLYELNASSTETTGDIGEIGNVDDGGPCCD